MKTCVAIARFIRPFTRKGDWILLSLAIWACIIGVLHG